MTIIYGTVVIHVYRPGTLAYLDTIANGLVPCRVVSVASESVCAGVDRTVCRVRVMATRGAYRVGEHVTMSDGHVVPRDHVYRSNGHFRIRNCYRWEPAATE